jgi:cellulose synthase operon protein C
MEKLNRKFHRRILLMVISTLAIGVPCSLPAQSTAEKMLLAKAQSLAAHGRLDMAVQTWQQVLLSNPKNTEALAGIAKADMQLGKQDEARQYLDRLRAAGGNTAAISQIEGMPHVAPQSDRLNEASRLAQNGQYAQAMRIYRDVFGSEPPAGNYALAYYDTEAAIPGDRAHAVEGLRKLSQQFPADSRYAITLGRILTYDPKTRSEGIALLQRYSGVPAAQNALKQAASWNAQAAATPSSPSAPAEAPKKATGPVGNPLEASAYRALNAGRLDEAERLFQQVLEKEPNNPRALSGMGYVFMKRQEFGEAADYLQRAQAAGGKGLTASVGTSQFWERMSSGNEALKAGNSSEAVEDYRAAVSMKPSNPDALEALGGVLMQQGNAAEAIEIFERVVRVAPSRTTAWRGLFLAQSESGDSQAALDTSNRMPANVRAQLNRDPYYLRSLAQDNLALGRKAEADRVVERALALPFPNQGRDLPGDQQMQYAALLMTAQRYEPALQLYRQVVEEDPQNIDAWRSLIAAQHQLHRDEDAIAEFGKMPQSVYDHVQNDAGFLVLIGSIYQTRREWDRAQKYLERALSLGNVSNSSIELQLADIYAAQGNAQKAYTIYKRELDVHPDSLQAWRGVLNTLHQSNHDRDALREIARMPEPVRLRLAQDPAYLQTLASIQAASGQEQAALRTFADLVQLYASENTEVPTDVQIQYGWVLLNAGDDRKLYSLVSSLSTSAEMTDEQQTNLNQLWAAWSIRRANSAAASGDQRRALAILETAARAFPGNTNIYTALAGGYLKAGQAKRAVAIYASLDMSQASLAQYQGAIGAALAAKDMKQAEAWLEAALDRYKDDASILRMAAQFEQARGDNGKAAAYYLAALAALGPQSPADMFSRPGSTGNQGTPLNGVPPTQQLMDLLAPTGRTTRMSEPVDPLANGREREISWQDAPVAATPTLGDFAGVRQDDRADDPFTTRGSDNELRRPQVTATLNDFATPPPRRESLRRSSEEDMQPQVSLAYVAAKSEAEPTASLAYVEPTAMKLPSRSLPAAQEGAARRSSSRTQTSDAYSPDPAGRLQSAVRELDTLYQQPEIAQSQDSYPPSGKAATQPGIPLEAPLDSETAQPETHVLPPLTGPAVRVQRQKSQAEQMQDQLAAIEGASSGWLGSTASGAFRSGQPGYDQLSAFSAPTEGSGVIGSTARLTVITQPVLLDSGTATGTETLQQGTLPKGAVPTAQGASGIGGDLQLRTSLFAASAGYTPYGFLVSNVTGGLYIHPPAGHFTLTFARDPITDTQLSYAGLRDQGSAGPSNPGNIWGGVIANAGELQIASGDSRWGWYMQGGGQYITGVHVPNNWRVDGTAGAYWGVWSQPDYGNLTIGMNFFGMHYAHNLRYFTYGQGGYFSPNAYIVAAVPVSFNGHYGPKFHYRVVGSVGVQGFNEETSPYFPLDVAIQGAQGNPYYPAMTSVGGNYNFESEASYAIAEHWYVGGYASFNNSRDYASSKAGFFVRYLFRPQPMLEETGPTGLFPVQGLRPFQVP